MCSSGFSTQITLFSARRKHLYLDHVTGRCCVCHICRRKPETLWRHCKKKTKKNNFCAWFVLRVNIISNILFFFFVREIKHLLQWRFMTTGQTPGTLSTLMLHGRPGKCLFRICISKEAETMTLGFCNRFHWLKGSHQQSNSTVEWYIPPSAASGFYRIKHFGHYKQMKGLRPVITPYEGTSDVFRVTRSFYS